MTKTPAPFTERGEQWSYDEQEDNWSWSCTDEQWQDILAAVPQPLLAGADISAARKLFSSAASDYLALDFHHRARFAKGSPANAWRKRRRHLIAAQVTIENNYHHHINEALKIAEAAVAAFETSGKSHQGRQSPEREWLYSHLLQLWTVEFKGKLTTGRPSTAKAGKRTPNSPAIRFLLAALSPILGEKMIGAEAAEKIIETAIKPKKQRR